MTFLLASETRQGVMVFVMVFIPGLCTFVISVTFVSEVLSFT